MSTSRNDNDRQAPHESEGIEDAVRNLVREIQCAYDNWGNMNQYANYAQRLLDDEITAAFVNNDFS